ncbi:MAG: geranylgeranyl reductase family protein [Pseudomonadota bacterium]
MNKALNFYDVIIVGSGPSGAVAAGKLAEKGHSVLLLDKATFPRDKICGDGLLESSIKILKKLELFEQISKEAFKAEEVLVFPFKNKSFKIKTLFYSLKRKRLDEILKKWAENKGALSRQGKYLGEILEKDDNIEITVANGENGKKERIKARFLILASGCQNMESISEQLNKKLAFERKIFALRAYCKAEWNIQNPQIYFENKFEIGYFWIFPMGNNIYNIGCGGIKNGLFLKNKLDHFLKTTKSLKGKNFTWLEKPKGAFINTNLSNLKHAAKGKVLLVGELLGTTYPLNGEGVGKAMESALIAAQTVHMALIKNDNTIINSYPKELRKNIAPIYKAYSFAEKLLYHKRFGKLNFYLICSCKFLSNYISDVVSERKKPADIKLFRFLYKLLNGFIK